MKKLAIVVLLVAVSCRRQVVVGSPAANASGASTARAAVQLFMAAAKAQDIQALGQVWGSATGPILATISSAEVEQRAIYVMCHLKQDSYQILGESPAPGGERVFALEVKFKDLTASTHFNAIRGPSERWYVRTLELEPLRDICAKK